MLALAQVASAQEGNDYIDAERVQQLINPTAQNRGMSMNYY
jgi:hypothetical protein